MSSALYKVFNAIPGPLLRPAAQELLPLLPLLRPAFQELLPLLVEGPEDGSIFALLEVVTPLKKCSGKEIP